MQTQQAENELRENVFDESGQDIPAAMAEPAEHDPIAEEARAAAEGGSEVTETAKFRIGDRTFATQDEALAFAESQVSTLQTEAQVADAYRQGIRDAMAQGTPAAPGVTPSPAAPTYDATKLYENPQEFLQQYAHQIKSETKAEFEQRDQLKTQSDNIWREFVDRHPEMADFRPDVEAFTQAHTDSVRGISTTKGRDAAYDWITTKMKSQWSKYEAALKPKRELPNSGGGASPTPRASGVTPKPDAKKALSFSEQIRSIRRRR